jgi:FkbM family methyltransferase
MMKAYWYIAGGRKVTVCGSAYTFDPRTDLPFNPLKFPYPKTDALSDIVQYADYVQMRSLLLYLEKNKDDKPAVIDIGAHHGSYAILLGKILQQRRGRLIAVEPNIRSFRILQDNVKINSLYDTVICENVAITDKEGELSLADLGSQSYVTDRRSGDGDKVVALTLEKLLKKYEINRVNILIIDIEGAELPALRGFPWDNVAADKIFCELHPYNWKRFGYDGNDFQTFLEDHGLHCFDMFFENCRDISEERYIGPAMLFRKSEK